MKHTPGPWRVKYEQNVETKDRRGIASCGGYATNDPIESHKVINENKANAHLIAAAPDMYEALRWLLHLCSGVSKGGEGVPVAPEEWSLAWGTALSAIAKAEGKAE